MEKEKSIFVFAGDFYLNIQHFDFDLIVSRRHANANSFPTAVQIFFAGVFLQMFSCADVFLGKFFWGKGVFLEMFFLYRCFFGEVFFWGKGVFCADVLLQMCQTEDHFDCQPAVLAALDFAKTANNGGIEDPEMAKKIDFEEFGAFLQAVKLYYSFCEVNVSKDEDKNFRVHMKLFNLLQGSFGSLSVFAL